VTTASSTPLANRRPPAAFSHFPDCTHLRAVCAGLAVRPQIRSDGPTAPGPVMIVTKL
jgi:hypothetical protein